MSSPRVPRAAKRSKKSEASESAPLGRAQEHEKAIQEAAAAVGKGEGELAFRAFQANLVSLISHELRTPLTSVISALDLLRECFASDGEGSPKDTESSEAALPVHTEELIRLARRNADKLQHALTTILDVGMLQNGAVRVRLREIDLGNWARVRMKELAPLLAGHPIELAPATQKTDPENRKFPTLADPRRLGRAFDLAVQMILFRMAAKSKLTIGTSSHAVTFGFELTPEARSGWEAAWKRLGEGGESGEAFAGVNQQEEGFLSRMEEGLGNELFLIQEILKLHQGKISYTQSSDRVTFKFELPVLGTEDGLLAVISSRAYETSTELASVAFALIRVAPNESIDQLRSEIQKILFRSSDAVYALPERGQIALVLDDCKAEDAPGLLRRMEAALNRRLIHGIAHCPTDGIDPSDLIELAQKRLTSGSPLSNREH